LKTVIILTVILAIFLVLLGILLRRSILVLVNHIFYRETYDHRQTLINFTSKMGNILNLEQLAKETLLTLSKAIGISKVLLLFKDRGSDFFTTQFVYPEPRDKVDNELRLFNNCTVVTWLQKESQVMNLKQIEAIPQSKELWGKERALLNKYQLEILCPLKSHGKLIGILGLGKKQSNKPYSRGDLKLITNTVNQAGVILENALLFQIAVGYVKEKKALNEKLIEIDKLRTDSLSKALPELQAVLMLSEKNGSITNDQQTQLEMILARLSEVVQMIDTVRDHLSFFKGH